LGSRPRLERGDDQEDWQKHTKRYPPVDELVAAPEPLADAGGWNGQNAIKLEPKDPTGMKANRKE
jgi:hypothetical protein